MSPEELRLREALTRIMSNERTPTWIRYLALRALCAPE